MSETRKKKGKVQEDKAAELLRALEDLCREKNIDRDFILDALEAALMAAYKRNFASAQNVKVDLNRVTGEIKVYSEKTVVEEVEDKNSRQEISLDDARKINAQYQLGDIVDIEVTPKDFGRVAALTAKQVVTQKIREAERENAYESSSKILNNIVPGRVKHIEENGRKSIIDACKYYKVKYIRYGDKAQLGKITGADERAAVSVNDGNFARAVLKKYAEVYDRKE